MGTANRCIIPGIMITKVRWLHDDKMQAERITSGKTRGTVIISLPTQAMQHEVVRKGIVINSQLYDTRLYSQALEVKQCFNCSQWGHSQAACGKRARCGECAGPHQTRECKKQGVSCCNCGRPHRAWQKKECRTFQAYYEDIQSRKSKFLIAMATIQYGTGPQPPPQGPPTTEAFTFTAPNKRVRTFSPVGSQPSQTMPKRGRGWPTFIDLAAGDRSQS